MSSLWDEQGRQKPRETGTREQRREVKLPLADQRVEPSPARDEGGSNVELWGQVWERENLFTALKRVERNAGAPGIDGMTVADLRTYLKEQWLEIRAALESETYQPNPVRRVEIPKPDGGVRLLGIPTVMDRLLQQAIAQVLTPIFERKFSPHSYGFRPGRNAWQAVQRAQSYIGDGRRWVVDLDLEKFFDPSYADKGPKLARRCSRKARFFLFKINSYLAAAPITSTFHLVHCPH